jgi:hypothetical protein
MSKRKPSNRKYEVGYRRPPTATKFAPGQSGNPKGRPKGSRPVGAVLQDIIQQKVAVTENGKTRRIPALEVVLRRLTNDAMKGDPKAIRLLLSLNDHYGDAPTSSLELRELLAEDAAILAEYLQQPSQSEADPSAPQKEGHDDDTP